MALLNGMDYVLYLGGVGLVIVIIGFVETWMDRRRIAALKESARSAPLTTAGAQNRAGLDSTQQSQSRASRPRPRSSTTDQ